MNANDRNRLIYEVRKAFPSWTYKDIADLVKLSRQRVQQIVSEIETRGIIDNKMEPRNNHRLDPDQPVSATQVARLTGIPLSTVTNWVSRGHIKVLEDPGQTGPGKVVLLDSVTLQERIDRHRPRPRRNRTTV